MRIKILRISSGLINVRSRETVEKKNVSIGLGSTVVLEKVSKDKVAKKTKLKTIKQRTCVPHMSKAAVKVWETFAAVRKTRESNDIIETALIVGLDRLNVSTCCENLNDSAFYDEIDVSNKSENTGTKEVSGVEKETGLFLTILSFLLI